MTQAHADFRARKHFDSLDGLRAVSIVAVVWHHCSDHARWLPMLQRGFLGVDLFFVISGFLITTLLLRERERTGAIALKAFYVRRFLRIFPPYYLMLALTCGYYVAVKHDREFAREALLSALYVSNLVEGHSILAITWSLSTEEQFYLLWPPVLRAGPRAAPWCMAAVVFASIAVACGAVPGVLALLGLAPGLMIVQSTLFPISLGVLVAHAAHDARGYAVLARVCGRSWSSAAFALLLCALINIPHADIQGLHRLAIQTCAAAWVVACVLPARHALHGALGLRALVRLGTLSYGVYLYHMVCRHVASKLLDRADLHWDVALFLLCMAATWGVAEVSYRAFEAPLLRMKTRLGG